MIKGIDTTQACTDPDGLVHKIKSATIEELYISLLETQVRFCSENIRQFLSELKLWQEAQSVLDAGCGPGAFVAELQDLFSNKHYFGIDLVREFILVAKSRFTHKGQFQFEVSDANTFTTGNFDVTLLWAVLQHVESTDTVLSNLANCTSQGFVILDAMPDYQDFAAQPEMPTLTRLFTVLHKHSRSRGRNIDCITEAQLWAKRSRWKVLLTEPFGPTARSEASRQNFFYYACFLAEMLERKYQLTTDFHKLTAELESWRTEDKASATHRGGQWLVLEK